MTIYSHNLVRHSGGGSASDTVSTADPVQSVGDLIVIAAVRFKDPDGADFPASSVTGFTLEEHNDPTGEGAGVVDIHMRHATESDLTGLPLSYAVNWNHTAPYGKVIGAAIISGRVKAGLAIDSSVHYDESTVTLPASGQSPNTLLYLTILTSNEGHDLGGSVVGELLDWTTSGVVRNAGWFFDDDDTIESVPVDLGVNNTGTVLTLKLSGGVAPTGDVQTDAVLASAEVAAEQITGTDAILSQDTIETGKFRPRQNQAATLGQVLRRVNAIERRASVSTYEQSYSLIGMNEGIELDFAQGVTRAVYSIFFPTGPSTSALSMRVPIFLDTPLNEVEVYLQWRSTGERTVSISAESILHPQGLDGYYRSAIFHWKYFTASASYLDVMVKRVAINVNNLYEPSKVGPASVIMHTTLPTATLDGLYGTALTSDQRQVFDINDNPIDPNVP